MKPKLYQYAACPFCNKVRAILRYKGVDFETIEVHPLNKKEIEFSKEYRAVPIYIDSNGVQVNDSTPIMRHIDRELPSPRVFEREGTLESKEELHWLKWSERFVKGLPTAIYDTFPNALESFNYITRVGKFSWVQKMTIKFSGAFIMTLVAKKIKKREHIGDPVIFLKTNAEDLVSGLQDKPFLGGHRPNGADLAIYGITCAVADLSAGRILDENPSFKSWRLRMEALLAKPALLS